MAHLQTKIFTHSRKVCSLYKRAIRGLEEWTFHRDELRYEAVLLRVRFEDNRNIKNMMEAQKLLDEGEEELFNKSHSQPKKFPNSPGGIAYEREIVPPDWILDYWHPIEKAAFPKYFALREKRKKEFIKFWERNYAQK